MDFEEIRRSAHSCQAEMSSFANRLYYSIIFWRLAVTARLSPREVTF